MPVRTPYLTSKFKKPSPARSSLNKKFNVPRTMGSERPRRRRSFYQKPNAGRRPTQNIIQFKRRWIARPAWKLRRKRQYYTVPGWKGIRVCRSLPLFRRYRFYTFISAKYLARRQGLLGAPHKSLVLQRQRKLTLTRLVRSRSHYRTLRFQHFTVSREQPAAADLRYRRRRTRSRTSRALFAPRKAIQLAVSRRLAHTTGRLALIRVKSRARLASASRLFAWSKPNLPAVHSHLRFPRLLASMAAHADHLTATAHAVSLEQSAANSLRRRLARHHRRAVTSTRIVSCGVCVSCKKAKKCRRPKRIYYRRGRRGYAGLFGKLRWRTARRDRRLIHRTSRRLALYQNFYARALSSGTRVQLDRVLDGAHTNRVRKQLSNGFTHEAGLLSRTKAVLYTRARHLLSRKYAGSLRSASKIQRKLPFGQLFSAPTGAWVAAKASRTPQKSTSQYKYTPAPYFTVYRNSVDLIPEVQDLLAWSTTAVAATPGYDAAAVSTLSRKKVTVAPGATKTPLLSLKSTIARTQPDRSTGALMSSTIAPEPVAAHFHHQSRLPHCAFLNRADTSMARKGPLSLSGNFALWKQRKRFKEQLFYHRRPKLRLPLTTATRRRRRKGGLGLFAQNSLKTMRTTNGLRAALFAPSAALSTVSRQRTQLTALTALDLRRVRQRKGTFPRHWARLPKWIDLKPLFWVRRAALARLKRRKFERVRRTFRRVRAGRITSKTIKAAITQGLRSVAPLKTVVDVSARAAVGQRAGYLATLLHRKALVARGKRQSSSGSVVQRLLGAQRTSNTSKRRSSLWQARSVRSMRQLEQTLCAWSPQYQTRARRWAYPRQHGVLLRRSWLSRRQIRERASFNASLTRRHRPRQLHWDRGFIHLQYYLGSVASLGYDRLRRTHRLHSRFSRWWKPVNQPVPFPHPFSRRAVNAKWYYRRTLNRALLPRVGGLAGRRLRTGAAGERMRRHMPSRQIPWRNFNYPSPKRGAPATIQRWTMRSVGAGKLVPLPSKSGVRKLILTRTPRELRTLEQAIPSAGVWANHRWESLDPSTKTTAESLQFPAIFNRIPASVWASLKRRVGSLSHYVALQRAIFTNYRQWGRDTFGSKSTPLAAGQLAEATSYLLNLIKLAMSATAAVESSLATSIATKQQRFARESALSQKVLCKQDAFWKHRTLPALRKSKLIGANPLRRENSVIYKHWLHGATRFLKRSQRAYTPTSRSRYSDNTAKDFGRRRLRFPASGRRRRSYDSMLHAFAKKTSPAQFRRASILRFVKATPKATGNFREKLVTTTVSAALRRQRILSYKLNAAAPLSVTWRELLTHRAGLISTGSTPAHAPRILGAHSKRRFASLPARAVTKRLLRTDANTHRVYSHNLRTVRAAILRRALRRRRRERVFIDLRASALHRRAPKERAIRPWKVKRRMRARLAARSRRWRRLREAKRVINWGLSHLSAKGTRSGNRAPISRKISPSGEVLLLTGTRLRRDRRALRGFSVLVPRRRPRPRKRLRDSKKGRQGRRRRRFLTPLGAMLLKTHWSEGRELRRLRRLGRRPSKQFVKKFISPLPRLFHAFYGNRRARIARGVGSRGTQAAFRAQTSSLTAAALTRQKRQLRSTKILLSPESLHKVSSLRRNRCLEQLPQKLAAYAADTIASRQLQALDARQQAGYHARSHKLYALRRASLYTGRKFIAPKADLRAVGPLWFQNPATKTVKSEAAKKRELEANISSKEARYKFTAQYVQNLTFFLPELINYMISRKLIYKREKITLNTARHLVRNIYWSLRIYLNVDPFDERFMIRDQSPATRVRMAKLMEDLSAEQRTEQPQRAALRYRLQPGRLIRVRNKVRFRGDWLRNFLPAQHALYLENADEYGLFLLKTTRITRLHYGPRGIASWSTAVREINQETRARQLLSLRYSRATPRFETMLQGTRRTPAVEGAPMFTAYSKRASFFMRAFSTQSNRPLVAVGAWLRQQLRLAPGGDGFETPSPYLAVTTRYRVLARIEARGKTNFVGAARPCMLPTFLDTRQARAKSPRSRQYLLRLATAPKPLDQFITLRNYRHTMARALPAGTSVHLTRGGRRFVRTPLQTLGRGPVNTTLAATRSFYRRRFLPVRLLIRQEAHIPHIKLLRHRAFASRRTLFPVSWAAPRPWLNRLPATVKITRSVLQSRAASRRTTSVHYKALLALPAEPVRVRNIASGRLRAVVKCSKVVLGPLVKRHEELNRRLDKETRALLKYSRIENSYLYYEGLVGRAQRAVDFATSSLDESKQLQLRLQTWKRSEHSRPLTNNQRASIAGMKSRIRRIQETVPRQLRSYARRLRKYEKLFSAKTGAHDAALAVYSPILDETEAFEDQSDKEDDITATKVSWDRDLPCVLRKGSRPRFVAYGGANYSSLDRLSQICSTQTRISQEAPFETHRTRLWDRLTLRRTKRERVARYWIKETGRWMRDPWIADIVNLEMRSKPGLLAGELRAREQQIGEYVSDVDERGKDIPLGEEDVPLTGAKPFRAKFRERHEYAPRAQPKMTELARIKNVRGIMRGFVHQRLQISKVLRKKPIPMMWLANYEYNDYWKEFKAEKAKSKEQKAEDKKARLKENADRAARGLAPIRERRYALKMPPLPMLPKIIWKEIHRRVKRLEWRESDEVFFRRGFRNAFRFYPQERNRAPWLEALMYTRATYSTRLREFRRRSFPREQKKYKWLQRVRKSLFPTRTARYIKRRKWTQLRMYNQRLHYSLFNLPDRNAARRHFRKLNRRSRPQITSFIDSSRGLGDRVDVLLMHLKAAPSIFWARIVAPFGLIRVNGVLIKDPAYRLRTNDVVHLELNRIARFQHFFEPSLRRREAYQRRVRRSTSSYPTNFEYHRGTRTLVYKHAPDESDLRKSSRLRANYFRWFKLDSV